MITLYGVFTGYKNNNSFPPDTLLNTLASSTPDQATHWLDNSVGLGNHSSTIITSPLNKTHCGYNTTTGLACTASSRLDNRAELYSQLKISHLPQEECTDIELIMHAYRRWGADCPNHLLGDYAFAIWDPKKKTLFCARDHIGVEPFYYCASPEFFIFANSLKCLLVAPNVPQQLDERYIAASLLYNPFVHNTRTYFKDIHKLPPGHSLTVKPGSMHVSRYWHPERAKDVRYKSDAEYADALQELLSTAVKDRLPSIDPAGVHLSGGLDSSGIAVLASRELKKQNRPSPIAFCWQPPPDNDKLALQDDYGLIQSVCDQEGMRPNYCILKKSDVLKFLHQDPIREPFTATNVYEQLVQQQAEKKGVQVILSGWGGDDGISFNRRGYYPGLLLNGEWLKLYRESKASSSAPWKFILSQAVFPLIAPDLSLRILNAIRHRQWLYPPKPFINPSFARRIKPLRNKGYLLHGIRQVQLQMLASGQITARLEGWAASGAKHNISYRYPLLDRRVLEFSLGLPPEQFQRGDYRRWIMRNAMNTVLPADICWSKIKVEPARVKVFFEKLPEILEQAAQTLESQPGTVTRSEYIDMPRLLKHLNPEYFRARPKWGNIGAALQLLDWQ